MAFVPGFDHDLFISYAHDCNWVDRFLDRLRPAIARLLPEADVWIDKDDLRKSCDFEKSIPAELEGSAVLLPFVLRSLRMPPVYGTRRNA